MVVNVLYKLKFLFEYSGESVPPFRSKVYHPKKHICDVNITLNFLS